MQEMTQMEIPIHHEKLQGQGITVKTAGFFGGPRLVSNGNPLKGKRGEYILRGTHGGEVTISVKPSFLDPVPKVRIDGEEFQLARPLAWYEYVWMGLPILLIFGGGALGAFIGISAAYTSSHIFRSDRSNVNKYLISGLISVAAVVLFFVFAEIIQTLIRGIPRS
jgi:hypothetical protein